MLMIKRKSREGITLIKDNEIIMKIFVTIKRNGMGETIQMAIEGDEDIKVFRNENMKKLKEDINYNKNFMNK